MDLRPFLFVWTAMVLSCAAGGGSVAESSEESAGRGDSAESPAAAPAEKGVRKEVRVPFLGGAFVTYSGEMPVDVHQAIAGEPTDHPVIVWAGD